MLPYLEGLAAKGHEIELLSFEKKSRWNDGSSRGQISARLTTSGIGWHPLRYHKRPSILATLLDLLVGAFVARRIARTVATDIIHARSYPSALIALVVSRTMRLPWIFDMRGLYAEERVEGGLWPASSARYRFTKRVEKRFFATAAAIVTLTEASLPLVTSMRDAASGRAPVFVIPTAVDLERFDVERVSTKAFTLAYLGSVGTWYLLDEMMAFGRQLINHHPSARLLFLVNGEAEGVQSAAERAGIPQGGIQIRSVSYEDVPKELASTSATMAFIRSSPSKVASAATKISESWAAGLPVAVNAGVGDAAQMVREYRTGVIVDPTDRATWAAAVDALVVLANDPETRRRCQQVAAARFSLDSAVDAYAGIYERIGSRASDSKSRRVVVVCPHPVDRAPAQRLKFEQYYSSWREAGFVVDVRPFWSERTSAILYNRGNYGRKILGLLDGLRRRVADLRAAADAHVVYLFLGAVPVGPPIFERLLVRSGAPIIYDIDDMVLLPHSSASNRFMRFLRNPKNIYERMRIADHVIVCTDHLREIAAAKNTAVTQISSTIDMRRYTQRRHTVSDKPVVLGWSGSHSTSPYLHSLDQVLAELQRTDGVRVLVIGDADFSIPGVELDARPWVLESEVAELSEIDIGLYPLPDNEWVLGKSGLKALQYMALGIPTVAQRRGMNLSIIDHGVNGFLADTPCEWTAILRTLILDPELRTRIGRAGRETVLSRYSVEGTAPVYLEILRSVARGGAVEPLQQ